MKKDIKKGRALRKGFSEENVMIRGLNGLNIEDADAPKISYRLGLVHKEPSKTDELEMVNEEFSDKDPSKISRRISNVTGFSQFKEVAVVEPA